MIGSSIRIFALLRLGLGDPSHSQIVHPVGSRLCLSVRDEWAYVKQFWVCVESFHVYANYCRSRIRQQTGAYICASYAEDSGRMRARHHVPREKFCPREVETGYLLLGCIRRF